MFTDVFLKDLARQDPDMGKAVKKWQPKMISIARTLVNTTGNDAFDVQQEMLEKIWADVTAYRTPMVRITGQLWTILAEHEDGTVDLRRGTVCKTILRLDPSVEEIRKASLTSYVYQGLLQFCADYFARHFTMAHGYRKDPDQPFIEKKVLNRAKKEIVTKLVPNFIQVSGERPCYSVDSEDEERGEDEIAWAVSDLPGPDVLVADQDLRDHLEAQLSPSAFALMKFLTEEDEEYLAEVDAEIAEMQHFGGEKVSPRPRVDLASAARYFGSSRKHIGKLFDEIVSELPLDTRRCIRRMQSGTMRS